MDYMKEIKEISAEQAIILWQAFTPESVENLRKST